MEERPKTKNQIPRKDQKEADVCSYALFTSAHNNQDRKDGRELDRERERANADTLSCKLIKPVPGMSIMCAPDAKTSKVKATKR